MELVEGATLLDHLNSLAEKKASMSEAGPVGIWQIFVQARMCGFITIHQLHSCSHVHLHHDPSAARLFSYASSSRPISPLKWSSDHLTTDVRAQVCLALRYCHKNKHVVHRDLTPSNIMINEDHVRPSLSQ